MTTWIRTRLSYRSRVTPEEGGQGMADSRSELLQLYSEHPQFQQGRKHQPWPQGCSHPSGKGHWSLGIQPAHCFAWGPMLLKAARLPSPRCCGWSMGDYQHEKDLTEKKPFKSLLYTARTHTPTFLTWSESSKRSLFQTIHVLLFSNLVPQKIMRSTQFERSGCRFWLFFW